jgi:hypothetical protein
MSTRVSTVSDRFRYNFHDNKIPKPHLNILTMLNLDSFFWIYNGENVSNR